MPGEEDDSQPLLKLERLVARRRAVLEYSRDAIIDLLVGWL